MMAAKSKNGTKAEDAAGAPAAGGEISKKMDMVRAALDELGKKAKPKEIVAFARDRFGAELSLNLVNNYKHHLVKKGGGPRGGLPARRERRSGKSARHRHRQATHRPRRRGQPPYLDRHARQVRFGLASGVW